MSGRARTALRVKALLPSLALGLSPLASFAQPVPSALDGVHIEEHLGAQLPLDLVFVDHDGRTVRFGELLDGRPLVLVLSYFDCPMLCGLVLGGVIDSVAKIGGSANDDFRLLTVSFDPSDTPHKAAQKRQNAVDALARQGRSADWPFVVGDADTLAAVAGAVGFGVRRDETTGQYAHPAAIFVLTPGGKVSRYLYGIDFPPAQLRMSIVEAGAGRTGSSFERLVLSCFRYDPASRRYIPWVFGFFRVGGGLLLACVGLVLVRLWRRERQERA